MKSYPIISGVFFPRAPFIGRSWSSRIRGVFGVVWTCPGGDFLRFEKHQKLGRLSLVKFFSCAKHPIFIKKRGIGLVLAQFLTNFLANVEGFFFHCTVKFPLQVMVSTYLMTRVHRCCTDEIPLLTVMCVFASEPESWSLFWFLS